MTSVHVSLAADLSQMARLGAVIRAEAASWAPDDPDMADRLELASHEVATNIVRHAYRAMDAGRIEVEITTARDHIAVTLRDQGRPFDASSAGHPDLDEPRIGGYGLYLAERLVDDVGYQRIDERNEWRLTCRRHPKHTRST